MLYIAFLISKIWKTRCKSKKKI